MTPSWQSSTRRWPREAKRQNPSLNISKHLFRAFGRVNEPAPPPLDGVSKNNYTRPEGQNVGNFVTGRNSSRVTAPPGGKSSVHFFGGSTPSVTVEDRTRRSMSPPVQQAPVEPPPNPPAPTSALPPKSGGLNLANNEYAAEPEPVGVKSSSNNYTRPGGRQNVGNYITGRNTSRVLAPPGGGSSVSFG